MTDNDYQHVLDELDHIIQETYFTMAQFESTGMDERMPQDYTRLEEILTQAVKDQRRYTQKMLNTLDNA
ncbi:hypothetical protein R5M92_10505 [Halomonas sp. Bachu 37]|uniref:hypothetical protein n=1 Tax=Halomonas kashgarensis TaxID=3084920 RepID=UPI0032178A65